MAMAVSYLQVKGTFKIVVGRVSYISNSIFKIMGHLIFKCH